jgi:hypothetical protein
VNARIIDHQALESLRTLELAAYLRSCGWTLAGYWNKDAATVWKHPTHPTRPILLPKDSLFADYARRIAEILDTLSEVEQRSQLQIIRDLGTAASDVIRLRVCTSVATDGSLGLEEGVTLIESAKDLILSAARAAVSPRAYYRSRLPGPADEYMKKVRLGQTEHGSYVVNVVCPATPELQPANTTDALNVEEPFDRRVTRTLASALEKTTQAANAAALLGDMEPFTASVRDGVSANLCAALAGIGERIEDGRIEVSFSWARSRRPPDAPSRVVVSHDTFPVMREAARVLRETYADDDFELIGPVIRLESNDATTGGDVLVYAEIDTLRKIRVHLDGADYQKAVRAHEQGQEIHCRGRLEKEGRYHTLRHIRDFWIWENLP